MSRLHHSYSGHLRFMQMSTTQIFVFVEGKHCDPYFFAQVCASEFGQHITYEISTARQLPAHSGGKQALLNFFSFLRTHRALVSDLAGNKTTCIFFLDKDVDDLQRIKKRSPHVVYTEHYDVQNYVFLYGDLTKGAASAASVDPRVLQPHIGNSTLWCRNAATLWKEWVSLCLMLHQDGISCEANYRVQSRVQSRPCGPTDPEKLHALTRTIARRSHIPVANLRQRLALFTAKVDRYYGRGEHHRVFKGKWFGLILADDVDRIMGGNPYDRNGLQSRVPSAIAATLDFSEPWANYFRRALRGVAAML